MRGDDIGHDRHSVARRCQSHSLRNFALLQPGDALLEILVDADFRQRIARCDVLHDYRRRQAKVLRDLSGGSFFKPASARSVRSCIIWLTVCLRTSSPSGAATSSNVRKCACWWSSTWMM